MSLLPFRRAHLRPAAAAALANAANTAGVEKVSVDPDGTIVFPATVSFNPTPGFTLTPESTGISAGCRQPAGRGRPRL
jgi:hypothetical protein